MGPIPAYAGETCECAHEPAFKRAYPRIRGGNCVISCVVPPVVGLSPHTRGKPSLRCCGGGEQGPIPAYAGETRWGWWRAACPRAYPRIRGGNKIFSIHSMGSMGLSPHTRGKLFEAADGAFGYGPIPAYAGETPERSTPRTILRAYPRIRGGNPSLAEPTAWSAGLSPHTRGKPRRWGCFLPSFGPIPAYAGETGLLWIRGKRPWAYPRIRGGNAKNQAVA